VLTQYQTQTQQLLQNPAAPATLYATSDLTGWINTARGQLAGEAECIRVLGTISTVINQRAYNFSSINVGVAAMTGVQGVIHVRSVRYAVGDGFQRVESRAWSWFELFALNNPEPQAGPPVEWSQFAQGSSGQNTGSGASGSFLLDPPPDLVYVLTCDCVCYPIKLVDDTTVEAIPFLWTDAVPYYAAYLALMSSQTNARIADAERLFGQYKTFVGRARQFANPSVLRYQYEQSPDLTLTAKLGLEKAQAGG
jgi:hypothetical protein